MSSIIKVDQIQLADGSTPTAGDLGLNVAGAVLQVVNTIKTDTESSTINNQVYSDIGDLSLTITAKGTNSSFIITYSVTGAHDDTSDTGWTVRCVRNGSAFAQGDQIGSNRGRTQSGIYNEPSDSGATNTINMTLMDSPSVSAGSTVTYKMQKTSVTAGSSLVTINRASNDSDVSYRPTSVSTLTVYEIAG